MIPLGEQIKQETALARRDCIVRPHDILYNLSAFVVRNMFTVAVLIPSVELLCFQQFHNSHFCYPRAEVIHALREENRLCLSTIY